MACAGGRRGPGPARPARGPRRSLGRVTGQPGTPAMKPCISQATTMSTPFEADLKAYARGGWSAVELWLTKLETFLEGNSLSDVRALLEGERLQAVAAAAQGGLLTSRGAERAAHWDHF